jgi:serine protease Do
MPEPRRAESVPEFCERRGAVGASARRVAWAALAAIFFVVPLSLPAFAHEAPTSFAPLIKEIAPAVVNVSTTQKVEGGPMADLPNLPENSPLRDFLKRFYNGQQNQPTLAHSLGSGFIIDPAGYVVTNNHVVGKATDIDVTMTNGKSFKAKLVGRDMRTDLALLKITADQPLPAVQWGDSDKAQVGDWVIAVGNPFGLGGSVTAGIVSARERDLHEGPYDEFLQTDAAINRGNSGGPMFDMDGKVIGINSAIYSPNGGSVGIGFAVPSALARPVIDQLKERGKVERGWLGVEIQEVSPEVADSLGLKAAQGALVVTVTRNGPAAKGGLRQGDVIETFDGKEIKELRDLTRVVADAKAGSSATVAVWREGKSEQLSVVVSEAPQIATADADQPDAAAPQPADEVKVSELGLTFGVLTADARKELGLKPAVRGALVTDVDENGLAGQQGLKPGDVIVKVGAAYVHAPKEAADLLKKAKQANAKAVLLLVDRRGEERFVAVPFSHA